MLFYENRQVEVNAFDVLRGQTGVYVNKQVELVVTGVLHGTRK